MKKIELTPEQIKDIFDAGYRKGESDQCAYEWGEKPHEKKDDELVWTLAEVLNCTVEVVAEFLGSLSS